MMIKRLFAPLALLVLVLPAHAGQALQPNVGDAYQIVRTQEVSETNGDGPASTSFDRDAMVERVLAVRRDGLELEYGLPPEATAQDRSTDWHLPVRVFKPAQGAVQLLNRGELEARVDPWLKAAHWTRAICGHWIFTWNAFRIDCDPETVLKTIAAFDLRPDDLRDGALYREPDMLAAAPLRRHERRPDGAMFVVELAIDPESVRRDEARTDQVVGEIMRKPITPEDAARAHDGERISGTMTVTFETDATGVVRKRSMINLEIMKSDGVLVKRTTSVTVERRKIASLQ